jgi:seryl-tRNA synthetase
VSAGLRGPTGVCDEPRGDASNEKGTGGVMSEEGYVAERSVSGALLGVVVVALLAALGGLVWCYALQNHLGATEKRLAAADQKNVDLAQRLEATNARLRATSETLGQSVGITQKQMEARTQSIIASQRAATAATAKLEEAQAATSKQIGAVSTDVASVKTDVGGVKTDVATTKSDLEATKTQLNRVVGDAGVMSGLIATNHDELEVLKHKGDRNYLEFTLQKGAKPTLLSTIKLQLKKADEKHSKYTLNVSADDRNIEKKDKGLDEPVQFYTGKDPVLYELVVNVIEKNKVSGYLSTPKNPTAKATAQ